MMGEKFPEDVQPSPKTFFYMYTHFYIKIDIHTIYMHKYIYINIHISTNTFICKNYPMKILKQRCETNVMN